MTTVSYSSTSPYYRTPQTSWYLDNWKSIDILPDSSDQYIELDAKYTHRPDLLAYDEYGRVDLWWVFASRNMDRIINPVFDMVSGLRLYIPTLEHINSSLGRS